MIAINDFEIGYLVIVFALLGAILLGGLLSALHLDRSHPQMLGAAIGALLGVVLIEAVALIT